MCLELERPNASKSHLSSNPKNVTNWLLRKPSSPIQLQMEASSCRSRTERVSGQPAVNGLGGALE